MSLGFETFETSAATTYRRSISSAGASLVRGTPPQARDLALLILEAASGTNSLALLESCARDGSSSRMLPPVLAAGLMPSEETWNGKVISRFRSLCRRVMSGRRTSGRGSSWSHGEYPTLSAAEYESSQNGSNSDRPSAGTPSLHTWARDTWATPCALNAGGSDRGARSQTKGGRDLNADIQNWPTVCASDWKSGEASEETRERNSRPLREAVVTWPTVTASDAADSRRHGYTITGHPGTTLLDAALSRQDPSTPKDGPRGRSRAVLSPAFCESLLGFPSGWTLGLGAHASKRSETRLSRSAQKSSDGSSENWKDGEE